LEITIEGYGPEYSKLLCVTLVTVNVALPTRLAMPPKLSLHCPLEPVTHDAFAVVPLAVQVPVTVAPSTKAPVPEVTVAVAMAVQVEPLF
jgi:hypothetical protein